MISNKTKAFIAALEIVAIASTTSISVIEHRENKVLRQEVTAKSAEFKALDLKLNELESKSDQLSKENAELQQYISVSEDRFDKVDEVTEENEELKKQNKALQLYLNNTPSPAPTSAQLSRGGAPRYKSITKITVEISMYTDEGKTASGTYTKWGTIAAPKEIPFGASIVIPELDTLLAESGITDLPNVPFKVEDRGGYIKKVGDVYRVDVYTPYSDASAFHFGRKRNMEAYLIE